jgi:hypothetical protein
VEADRAPESDGRMTTLAVRSAGLVACGGWQGMRSSGNYWRGEDGPWRAASHTPEELAALFCASAAAKHNQTRVQRGRRMGTALILEMAGKISNIARKRWDTERHSAGRAWLYMWLYAAV